MSISFFLPRIVSRGSRKVKYRPLENSSQLLVHVCVKLINGRLDGRRDWGRRGRASRAPRVSQQSPVTFRIADERRKLSFQKRALKARVNGDRS